MNIFYNQNRRKAFLLFFLLFISLSSNTQIVTASLKIAVRDITDLDIGFNRRSDKGDWWSDASFKTLVSDMNPDVLRYPGGTQANYWDWRTGKFLDNTDKSWNNKEVLKIPDFVDVVPDRTKIIYVVNMVRPTPTTGVAVNASEETLKSTATLNLKIDDMIAAINEFKNAGKMPYAVELGNEFYFGNEEGAIFHIVESGGIFKAGWDAANNAPFESNTKKEATIVNAKFYLEQCKTIVGRLKTEFPTLKVALTTTKGGNGNSTRERWNNTIFDELENNSDFSTLKTNIDAVTQHHYLNDNYGVQTVISDDASSKIAIAEGIEYPLDKVADYNLVPNDFKIWYTEFGEVKEIAEETWASAVRYAAFNYGWISLGDKVGQLDWHYVSDNNVVKVGASTDPMTLAPVGIAAKILLKAAANMQEMQEVEFTNNTISVNAVKSLYGLKFKNDEKETLLIINTNNTDFSDVNFSASFTYKGQPKITQYYSNDPYISGVSDGSTSIQLITGDVTNTTEIKRFSVAVIEVSKYTTTWNGSVSNNWNIAGNWTPAVVPTTTSDILIPRGLTKYPTANSALNVDDITIESGATFRAKNTVTTVSGKVKYKRNLSTSNWYSIASPLAGETLENLIANHSFSRGTLDPTNLGLASYDNTQTDVNKLWNYKKTSSTGALNSGEGLIVKLATAGDVTFSGTINAANVLKSISIGAGNGYNFAGNPYTAYINSSTFLSENTDELETQTIWIWDQMTNGYITKVTVDNFKVAPGQGFFVKASSSPVNGSILFDKNNQSHKTTDTFLKSAKIEIQLFLKDITQNKIAKIYYLDNATSGFDNGYDGELFGGTTNSFEIFSHLVSNNVGKKYQVQSVPNSNFETTVIPLGFIAEANKEITISAKALNLPAGIKMYLEDKETTSFTRLDEVGSTYKFTFSQKTNGVGRFYLHTRQSVLNVNDVAFNNVSIYQSKPSTISVVGLSKEKVSFKLFTILGEQIIQENFQTNRVKEIALPKIATGIYIVHLQSEKGILKKKILLK